MNVGGCNVRSGYTRGQLVVCERWLIPAQLVVCERWLIPAQFVVCGALAYTCSARRALSV